MTDAQIIEPVLLAALAKQGIAAGNVELRRDYAPRSRGEGYSPYARTYQDALTKRHFAVISGLPGCDAYGQAHELTWRDNNGVIESGNNIFHGKLSANGFQVSALSEQPNGVLHGEGVAFHPQLFIGGVEIRPVSDTPRLLETDPLNENYHNNTLEWDYGVCRRRVRLIEGRFLGSWVFTAAPQGDVQIKYNQTGKFRLRLQYAKDADTEFIPRAYFEEASDWPVEISDSATFYPDANPESSSVDGETYRNNNFGEAWATLVANAGTNSADAGNSGDLAIIAHTTENLFKRTCRFFALFDTSSIGAGNNVTAATFSIRGYSSKSDGLATTPTINIYSSNPASNTELTTADHFTLGSIPFCDTPIAHADWLESSTLNDFILNSVGLDAVDVSGVTKLGMRLNYDVSGTPNWVSGETTEIKYFTSERGSGYQPKLVVTYTTGITEKSAAETGAGVEVITSGNPIAIIGDGETGAGVDGKMAGSPNVMLGGVETGAGLESLESLGLGVMETGAGAESLGSRDLGNIETGTGAESLGSRELGKAETGSGLDIASLLASLAGDETGVGAEAALKIAAFFSGDSGLGAEISWMLKDALAGDAGLGADALKSMIKTAGSATDMRLYESPGQGGLPSKQVRMPSKGVNL